MMDIVFVLLVFALAVTPVLISVISWGWIVSIASREGETLLAIGCFLVPPLVLLYALTNYEAAKIPFWLLIGSVGLLGTFFLVV